MKKHSEFELIGIGLTLLVLCILISLVGKHIFDLDGDYLSAAATLFAAVVAMLLFNDWKVQHRFNRLDYLQPKLRNEINTFHEFFQSISSRLRFIPDSSDQQVKVIFSEISTYTPVIFKSANSINVYLSEYIIFIKSLDQTETVSFHVLESIAIQKTFNELVLKMFETQNTEVFDVYVSEFASFFWSLDIQSKLSSVKMYSDISLPQFYSDYFEEQ